MSLYTKYRSQTFDDLVEQDSIKTILKNQVIKINSWEVKLSNYIFFWPRWTGKTSVARIFAKAINCTNNNDWNPCNKCDACIVINTNKTLDVVEIDAASHTWVDNIRDEIISKAVYPPSNLRKKIYIIDEAHMLSKSAFNALLKIIEEPPEYLVFILATTDPQKILDTVKSRCQLFWFKNISIDGIIGQLKYVCEKENIWYDDQWLYLIAKIANWWMRDALKYLDQISGVWDASSENVIKTLWITNDTMLIDFVDVYQKNDLSDIYDWIDNLVNWGYDLWNFLKDLAQFLDKSLTVSNLSDNISLIQVIRWYFETIRNYPYPSTVLKYQISIAKNESWSIENIKDKKNNLTEKVEKEKPKIKEEKSELLKQVDAIEESLDKKEEENKVLEVDPKNSETDLWAIKQYIIDNSGTTIKNIWAKSCDVVSLKANILEVAVISQWSINILESRKADTEKLAKELLGQNITINYKIVNSEDLLQNIFDTNWW